MNEIQEVPIVHDEYGGWTHPEYENFCDGREYFIGRILLLDEDK